MNIQDFHDEIMPRIADGDFIINITDEDGYWHIKATKEGKSAGALVGKKMLSETRRFAAMLDLTVAELLMAWALSRYHRPVEKDWGRQ